MNNNAAQIYQMFRQSPFPGATSVNAISERLDELKKDKRWQEEYDLHKKQIESAMGYRDLQKKLMREKADRDRKANEELLDFREKAGILTEKLGRETSMLSGALRQFPGITPPITPEKTTEQFYGGLRGLAEKTYPEKFAFKEPKEPKALTELGLFMKDPESFRTYKEAGETPAKESAWEIKEKRARELLTNGKILIDQYLKMTGGYIEPKKKSDFEKKLAEAKKEGASKDEIKKLLGTYIKPEKETLSLKFQKEKYQEEKQEEKDTRFKNWFTKQVVGKDGNLIRITDKKKYDSLNKHIPKINELRKKDDLPPVELKLYTGFGRNYWQLTPKLLPEKTGTTGGQGTLKGKGWTLTPIK